MSVVPMGFSLNIYFIMSFSIRCYSGKRNINGENINCLIITDHESLVWNPNKVQITYLSELGGKNANEEFLYLLLLGTILMCSSRRRILTLESSTPFNIAGSTKWVSSSIFDFFGPLRNHFSKTSPDGGSSVAGSSHSCNNYFFS